MKGKFLFFRCVGKPDPIELLEFPKVLSPEIRCGEVRMGIMTRANPLRAVRIAAGLNQAELAKRAAISQQALRRIERGERGFGPGEIRRLAAALELDTETLRAAMLAEAQADD